MGRSCGGVDFGYNASDDVYQIYLIFEAFQIDIEDNPYLKDTKVQIRDSCSYPRKFPNDGKGNYEEYLKIPRGMAESDPYYKTYLIPCVEDGKINPSTGSYYTDDELFALYPWSAGEKEYGFFRCSTSKLYSWGQRIYNQLNNEETVNTVECDILYYLDEILNIRKALVNRDYTNCATGMFWRMQKRGFNSTYINSNTLPPAFFLPDFNNIELYHKASYSRIYPFFKWFDYYENFNPRRRGYTCSLLQYYDTSDNPASTSYYSNINESVFNFFGPSFANYSSMGFFTNYTDLGLNYRYYDTNTLPPYVVYAALSDVEYKITSKEKYIYIRRKPICYDIGIINYISNMTWPKTILVSSTVKIENIIDSNQDFGVPVIPQDIKDRATQISSILQNGITLKTNEEYYNARYYQSESKKYKYYKEYTTPNGTNKIIDDDYDLYIIKEDDRSVFAYDTNIPYRIKDRGGFITANFSNDTNEWKYEGGFWKLQSGSQYIKDLRNHKYIQPILGFDGTAVANYYLVIYNNKTGQYQSITRLSANEFATDERPTPSSSDFNPSNFRNKLPDTISYTGIYANMLHDFSIDLKSPTNDSTYTVEFSLPVKTIKFE